MGRGAEKHHFGGSRPGGQKLSKIDQKCIKCPPGFILFFSAGFPGPKKYKKLLKKYVLLKLEG